MVDVDEVEGVFAVGVGDVGRQAQPVAVPDGATAELVGVGLALGRPVIAVGRVGPRHRGALRDVGAGAHRDVRQPEVAAAEDREEQEPVLVAAAIALEEAVGVDFELGRRLPLNGGVGRRAEPVAVSVEQRLCVGEADARGAGCVALVGGADHQRLLARRVEEVDADIGGVHQHADLANTRLPAVADEKVAVPAELARLFPADAVERARQLEAVEVERLAAADVDLAADAALDQVGGARLVDLERGDGARGEVLDLDEAALGGEDLAAVIGGRDVGQAAHGDARRLAATARHRDARHARQRARREGVGELADVLGDDRVDDAVRRALDRLRRFEAAAQAGDDDFAVVGRGRLLLVGIGGGGVDALVGRGFGHRRALRTGLRSGRRSLRQRGSARQSDHGRHRRAQKRLPLHTTSPFKAPALAAGRRWLGDKSDKKLPQAICLIYSTLRRLAYLYDQSSRI